MSDSGRGPFEAELLAARANADTANAALRALNAILEQRVANEIKERRAVEDSLMNERKISAPREESVDALRHDLRNHLAAIAAGVRMISKTPLDESGARLVPLIRQSVLDMTSLIDKSWTSRVRSGGASLDGEAVELAPVAFQVMEEQRAGWLVSVDGPFTFSAALRRPGKHVLERLKKMLESPAESYLENLTFDELKVGDTASLEHTVTQRDIDLFATATGDINPAHVDPEYAAKDIFHHVIIQGMWGAGLISATLGTKLPGPGTIYLAQDLRFVNPVGIGDTITARVTVREKRQGKSDVVLDCLCVNQAGQDVITGNALVRAPSQKIRVRKMALPSVRVERHDWMQAMTARAATGAAISTAVVYPVDAAALLAAIDAAKRGLITPVLIGPSARILEVAEGAGVDIGPFRLVDIADAPGAAAKAVELARAGEVAMLMKGDLHTSDLMHAVVAPRDGLRTGRRISHVYLMDVPDYPRPLLVTDGAINIAPALADKAGICQNAIDLAHVIGIPQPRVAILAAVETVNDKMQSTLDAAALCKMADRGQITGALLDGPLAFDNAINQAAAAEKGIVSPVAGCADILLVPNIEAGNMLAKQLSFMAGAEAAGLVLGARVPIILTSRADSARSRLASCALGVLVARAGKSQ